MSDPVKNVEIEDVLSSIRRLVSQDVRPRTPSPRAEPDRLVLTPSQRVADRDGADSDEVAEDPPPVLLTASMAEGAAEAETEPAAGMARGDTGDMEDAGDEARDADDTGAMDRAMSWVVEQELAAFFHRGSGSGGSGGSGKAAEGERTEAAEAVTNLPADAEHRVEDAAPDDVQETDEDTEASPVPAPKPRPAPTLEQKVAELEAMIARGAGGSPADWEPETAAEGDNAAFTIDTSEPLPWQDYEAEAPRGRAADRAAARQRAELVEDGDDEQDAPFIAVDPAPQDDAGIAYFHKHRDPAQRTGAPQASARAEPPRDETADSDSQDSGLGDEAVTIDEAMLRDMVADIVRQELQGALGERITRNVRKLVRREIQRALLSQELD